MKVFQLFNLTFYLLLIGIITSCGKEGFDCVKSTGKIIKEERVFLNATEIYLEDNINIILKEELNGVIVVEAGENLLTKISTEEQNGILTIRNNNRCNWARSYNKPINIYVGVDNIKRIIQTGYGNITGESFTTDTLRINSITAGNIELTMKAVYFGFVADDKASYTINGEVKEVAGAVFKNALINTKNLKVKKYGLYQSSILDTEIHAEESLHVDIMSSGNIICYGNPPEIEYRKNEGTGKVILK